MEKLALRHQIGVLTRALGDRHPRFGGWDRALWVVLARRWQAWRHALAIIQPATVVRWDVTITKLHLLQAVRNKQRSSCLSIRSEALRFR